MRNVSIALIVGILAVQHAQAIALPEDAKASFYADAIRDLIDRNVVEGYPDGRFKPKKQINRAEFTVILLRSQGDVAKARRRCFADVPLRVWYADIACEAKERGIVRGEKGGFFEPERGVNYAEALKIITETLKLPVADQKAGEQWFDRYVNFAHDHGIASKYAYIPWQPVTRERMADIVKRALDYKDHPELGRSSARLSPGCAAAKPSGPPSRVTVHGVPRDFIAYIPADYVADAPRKIVFVFHGRTDSAAKLRGYVEFEKYGKDYIVVYPQALTNGNGTYNWADGGDKKDQLRDFAFFDEILRSVSTQYCIDMNEIYVAGYSLGAWFANAVACARADIVRGMASLGGSSPYLECASPVAAMIMHNPKDSLAPLSGGEQARDMFRTANLCDDTPPYQSNPSEFKCVKYSCAGDPVLWCPHEIDQAWWDKSYYPHVWPRGAAQHIIGFFESLPR